VFGDFLAPTHIALILLVALLVLGPKRLPEVGKSLGKGLRDFREAMSSYSPESLMKPDEPTTVINEQRGVPTAVPATAQSAPDVPEAPAVETVPDEPTVDAGAFDDTAPSDAVETPATAEHPAG
jgi:sec-independent protein translocase protein TatA